MKETATLVPVVAMTAASSVISLTNPPWHLRRFSSHINLNLGIKKKIMKRMLCLANVTECKKIR